MIFNIGLTENQPGFNDRISLGQKCTSTSQCQATDPNSACLNGVCQCVMDNPQCGYNNTGCHPLTFQVLRRFLNKDERGSCFLIYQNSVVLLDDVSADLWRVMDTLIVKMLPTRIVVNVLVRPVLFRVDRIAYLECLFAMESSTAQMDRMKLDVKLKKTKVKHQLFS